MNTWHLFFQDHQHDKVWNKVKTSDFSPARLFSVSRRNRSAEDLPDSIKTKQTCAWLISLHFSKIFYTSMSSCVISRFTQEHSTGIRIDPAMNRNNLLIQTPCFLNQHLSCNMTCIIDFSNGEMTIFQAEWQWTGKILRQDRRLFPENRWRTRKIVGREKRLDEIVEWTELSNQSSWESDNPS